MGKRRAKKGDWVVPGGKVHELAHCTRCGRGLSLGGIPQPILIVTAAMTAFVKMHSGCKEGQHVEPTPLTPGQWAAGRDVGTSSLTIYSVMTGLPTPHLRVDIPHDPDDFGRCYRLLKLFPRWRVQLPQVAKLHEKWKPIVEHWDELTALYEEELPAETAPKLYQRMKELSK